MWEMIVKNAHAVGEPGICVPLFALEFALLIEEHNQQAGSEGHHSCKVYVDLHLMLEKSDKDIDVVVVATPNHVHAVASMATIRAGRIELGSLTGAGPGAAIPSGICTTTVALLGDFGGGKLGNFGCHTLDIAVWALDLEHPTLVD